MINQLNSTILTRAGAGVVKNTALQFQNCVKFLTKKQQIEHDFAVSYALRAEQISSGGFLRSMQNDVYNVENCTIPNVSDVECLISKYTKNQYIQKLIKHVLNIAGKNGKVLIEKSDTDTTSVELVLGNHITVNSLFKIKNAVLSRPRIICIDGYIESISEITNLLEECAKTKQTLILVSHGASDDVVNTLNVNFLQKTLNIYCYNIPKDLNSINLLKDIAVISNCDIVSKFKGQILNSLSLNDAVQVEEVICYNDSFLLKNSKTRHLVQNHIILLQNRLKNETDDVQSLLTKRIRTLSSLYVVIRLKNDNNFIVNSQAIDYTIRMLRTCHLGITNEKLAATEISASLLLKKCSEQLENLIILEP